MCSETAAVEGKWHTTAIATSLRKLPRQDPGAALAQFRISRGAPVHSFDLVLTESSYTALMRTSQRHRNSQTLDGLGSLNELPFTALQAAIHHLDSQDSIQLRYCTVNQVRCPPQVFYSWKHAASTFDCTTCLQGAVEGGTEAGLQLDHRTAAASKGCRRAGCVRLQSKPRAPGSCA